MHPLNDSNKSTADEKAFGGDAVRVKHKQEERQTFILSVDFLKEDLLEQTNMQNDTTIMLYTVC